MRGTKGFPRTVSGTDALGSASGTGAGPGPGPGVDAGSDERSGWFVLHGAVASAVAALLSYQLAVIVVADGAMNARPSVNFAGLIVGLAAGVWTAIVALLAWPVLNAQATRRVRRHGAHPGARFRAIRRRGFSVLHIVAIGTAVPWIVLSLLLGSWQATTITIVVAVVAGAAGGAIAARRVWRPNRMSVVRRRVRPAAGIGPALEHLPVRSDDVDSLSRGGAEGGRGASY